MGNEEIEDDTITVISPAGPLIINEDVGLLMGLENGQTVTEHEAEVACLTNAHYRLATMSTKANGEPSRSETPSLYRNLR